MKKLCYLLIVLAFVLAGCVGDRSDKTTAPNCDQISNEDVVAGMPCSPVATPTGEGE